MTTEPTIQNLSVDLLQVADANPNVMPTEDFETLCRAIAQKGMIQPILVRRLGPAEYRVIDGHHRLRAAKVAAMEQITCVVYECTDTEEHILRLAMNKLRGELDLTAAGHIFKELNLAGVKLDELLLTGFSESEMNDLIGAVSQNIDVDVKMALSSAPDDYDVEKDEGAKKPLVLEIAFESAAQMKRAKRGLLTAAGKGKDLAVGLFRLLGEDVKEVA
jgi:ParB/RepB/Spo0J family partition protein